MRPSKSQPVAIHPCSPIPLSAVPENLCQQPANQARRVVRGEGPRMPGSFAITLTVNGRPLERHTRARTLLSDFLKEEVGLTGVRVGCEHGVCGACTILVDGRTTRACLMLAVQADGANFRTVEG